MAENYSGPLVTVTVPKDAPSKERMACTLVEAVEKEGLAGGVEFKFREVSMSDTPYEFTLLMGYDEARSVGLTFIEASAIIKNKEQQKPV